MRIIPRNTKVSTEFFSGVSLADIVVGAIGVFLIFFVIISNLPYKIGICGTITAIFVLLLVRIDTEANYMFLHRILKHFSYNRSYRKVHADALQKMESSSVKGSSGKGKSTAKKSNNKKAKDQKTGLSMKKEKKKDEGAA